MKAGSGLLARKYDGANKYVMHFPKGQLPPAKGFWSLTMYDENYFFVANPINRYSISARQNLKSNPDGSVDLYIQNDSPGADKESNWLPAPAGKFVLMLRLYWPTRRRPRSSTDPGSFPRSRKPDFSDRAAPDARPCGSQRTLPGLSVLFGSSAVLKRRITSIATASLTVGNKSRFSTPMPCSAEMEP